MFGLCEHFFRVSYMFKLTVTPDELEPGLIMLAHNSGGTAEAADFFLRTPTLTASNFKALRPTDPKLSALKDLNLFLKHVKFQGSGRILKVGFVLSK